MREVKRCTCVLPILGTLFLLLFLISCVQENNHAPIANAGVDQIASINDIVTLSGLQSSDEDNDRLTYQWKITSKPQESKTLLENSKHISPSLTLDVVGTYVIQLIVSDGKKISQLDFVTIFTINEEPIAVISNMSSSVDRHYIEGDSIVLDASQSYDPEAQTLFYHWSFNLKPKKSAAKFSNIASVSPNFIPDQTGVYIIYLIVDDGLQQSKAASLIIEVSKPARKSDTRPIAEAGSDQAIFTKGVLINLDGSASYDAENDPLNFNWEFLVKPVGSVAKLNNNNVSTPQFTADILGDYVLKLVVNDVNGESHNDIVIITHHENAGISCADCHNNEITQGKTSAHQIAFDDCIACHNRNNWQPHDASIHAHGHNARPFLCDVCHDGITARQKPNDHLLTSKDCYFCHKISETSWLPATTIPERKTFTHRGITNQCHACHDNKIESGKPLGHIPSSSRCGACHQSTAWLPAKHFEHHVALGTCTNCHSLDELGHELSNVTSGNRHSCVLHSSDVICWGDTGSFDHDWGREALGVTSLLNPQLLTSNNYTNCAIDDNGLSCWGLYGNVFTEGAPELNNVKQLSMGLRHLCALDSSGVKCWGSTSRPLSNVPEMIEPSLLSSGGSNHCAIHRDGVSCWGSNEKVNEIPSLKNPRQVSVGSGYACALDDTGVLCWGGVGVADVSLPALEVPTLEKPFLINAGTSHACAIDVNGVTCWGDNEYNKINAPQLSHPREVMPGGNHTCALDDTGIVCWGLNYYAKTQAPSHLLNPVDIASNFQRTCTIANNSVRCWGIEKIGWDLPTVSISPTKNYLNPKRISLSEFDACVSDDSGLSCWDSGLSISKEALPSITDFSVGWDYVCAMNETKAICEPGHTYGKILPDLGKPITLNSYEQHPCILYELGSRCFDYTFWNEHPITIPDFKNPVELSMGWPNSCVIDDRGLVCWGWQRNEHIIQGLLNPRGLSVYQGLICVIEDLGVACWDNEYNRLSNIPTLLNPKKISVGKNYFCGIDDTGIVCWDRYPLPTYVRWINE